MNDLLSSDESEDEHIAPHRAPRYYRIRIEFANLDFYEHFRMSRIVFEQLLNMVGRYIDTKSATPTALTATDKMLITLNFLGTNDPYFCVADSRFVLILTFLDI